MPSGEHLKGRKLPGSGRKKGTPNKATPIKAVVEAHFAALCGGRPDKYLDRVAEEDPGVYLQFVGKNLPKQVEHSGPDKGPIIIRSNVHDDKP